MDSEWRYLEVSDEETLGVDWQELGLRCESRGRTFFASSKRELFCENDEEILIYAKWK